MGNLHLNNISLVNLSPDPLSYTSFSSLAGVVNTAGVIDAGVVVVVLSITVFVPSLKIAVRSRVISCALFRTIVAYTTDIVRTTAIAIATMADMFCFTLRNRVGSAQGKRRR